MKALLAAAMVFGSTAGAMADESYGDYRDYFDAKPATVASAPRRAPKMTYPIDMRRLGPADRVERYGYENGGTGRTADVRPRSWDGGYVPMDPRAASRDGFWSPLVQSSEGREPNQHSYVDRAGHQRFW
ncbi:hypothetical protein SAMN05216360_11158 [Methylobacterium phyllostachyos]|uniref:Uncharacterized protein n=1 Tax=Methylobacterium phyllostachyos TaxID=582672 RepID=A0A1H0E544_9HYPH|nr:hypothetical protein [Methylobacterium phyllostachyos]SDN77574.1 hypothetical protein SAMN05216360_11158 [Methylobacterium phyllostachyos]